MPIIHINNVVWFSPNNGVYVEQDILNYSSTEIRAMLEKAYAHNQDNLLVAACCGGTGPFVGYGEISFKEYINLNEKFEKEIALSKVSKEAKQENVKIRRNEFGARRAQLTLLMLNTGISYICAHPNCEHTKELTIDHIMPLSKGGTDEITNLQFLCKSHNSSKGDRVGT